LQRVLRAQHFGADNEKRRSAIDLPTKRKLHDEPAEMLNSNAYLMRTANSGNLSHELPPQRLDDFNRTSQKLCK
jgi:hypothetical protein